MYLPGGSQTFTFPGQSLWSWGVVIGMTINSFPKKYWF
jgi:hypothetical protein